MTTPCRIQDPLPPEPNHRNHDAFMEDVPAPSKFPSRAAGVETASRRKQSCLGVTRTACLQPIGASREDFYEHRLLLTLPWRCEDGPASNAAGQEWSFLWTPPSHGPAPVELRIGDKPTQSFEKICKDIELDICSFPEKICACCAVAGRRRSAPRSMETRSNMKHATCAAKRPWHRPRAARWMVPRG